MPDPECKRCQRWQKLDLSSRCPSCDSEVLNRRFGPAYDLKCKDETIIVCMKWKCQDAGECQSKGSFK